MDEGIKIYRQLTWWERHVKKLTTVPTIQASPVKQPDVPRGEIRIAHEPSQRKIWPIALIGSLALLIVALIAISLALLIVALIAIPSLFRSRMAANETAAVKYCKAFASAEKCFHYEDYGQGIQYAQHLKGDLCDLGLITNRMAQAEGNPSQHPTPATGYCFKVLTGQGSNAVGGRRSYLVRGKMTLGYALVAYPAVYDSTGRDSFMVNNDGTVYCCDLGIDTHKIVEAMTEFDPVSTSNWHRDQNGKIHTEDNACWIPCASVSDLD